MTKAWIYRPRKTAVQAGRYKTAQWVLESPSLDKGVMPLMGWSGGKGEGMRLVFQTKEDAIAYAQSQNIAYHVLDEQEQAIDTKCYADNFKASFPQDS